MYTVLVSKPSHWTFKIVSNTLQPPVMMCLYTGQDLHCIEFFSGVESITRGFRVGPKHVVQKLFLDYILTS